MVKLGGTLSSKPTKSRDFDHLIEQNSTELDFLSAYGGLTSDSTDVAGIFSAIKRFLKAGGVEFTESETKLTLDFGYVQQVENGCCLLYTSPSPRDS